MDTVSPDIEKELSRRVQDGEYESVDALLRAALAALDEREGGFQAWLEAELLRGMQGKFVEMTPDEWESIEAEAMRVFESNRKP